MRRYKLDVGHQDKVKPGNILGAIANEAEIDSCYIGAIEIYETFSTVDLPDGMPKETFKILKHARVCGKKLNIADLNAPPQKSASKKKSTKNKAGEKKATKKRSSKTRVKTPAKSSRRKAKQPL